MIWEWNDCEKHICYGQTWYCTGVGHAFQSSLPVAVFYGLEANASIWIAGLKDKQFFPQDQEIVWVYRPREKLQSRFPACIVIQQVFSERLNTGLSSILPFAFLAYLLVCLALFIHQKNGF